MSLEAALDEERRQVMELLEGRPSQARLQPNIVTHIANPAPQIRSMLEVDFPATPSPTLASSATATTNTPLKSAPLTSNFGSMLDPQAPPSSNIFLTLTANRGKSATSSGSLHRTQSDAASHPAESRPQTGSDRNRNIHENYQFNMTPTVQANALPKRVTQGGKKAGERMNSMASIIQGQELTAPPMPRDRGRHNSTAGILGKKSKSPSSRLRDRSQSPGSMLNTNSFNLMPTPGQFVTEGGKVIDLNNAYRRLSDANLLKSGSSLSRTPAKDPATQTRLNHGETLSPSGEIRLQKDYYQDDDGPDGAIESSDEDGTSDEDAWGTSGVRGRQKGRKKKVFGAGESDNGAGVAGKGTGPVGMGRSSGPRTAHSLMAAAEEERKSSNLGGWNRIFTHGTTGLSVSSQYKVKSLLELAVTVTGPGGERIPVRSKPGVHPNTNYNAGTTRTSSPVTSDSEDLSDIRRAQRLSINQSAVDTSVSNRAIRTIVRGEFSKLFQEAEEGVRRVRTYLVATDLSSEAAYALEWTIGTVLRDGDTLMAIYAVDEEVGTGKSSDADSIHTIPQVDGSQVMAETTEVVNKLTAAAQEAPTAHPPPLLFGGSALVPGSKDSRGTSTDSRFMSKGEQERLHAIEDISQTCIKFLRKTRLQVRVAVEVIHCKSPKHLLTGAVSTGIRVVQMMLMPSQIDQLEPTLVILGSRGRSALKGSVTPMAYMHL